MAAQEPSVRYATEADVPEILAMIHELAEYEREPPSTVKATLESLRATLSFPPFTGTQGAATSGFAKTVLVFGPEDPAMPAGMALFFHNYSTWEAAPGVYLEDLFVRPQHRGKGYGSVLLRELAKVVLQVGGRRLEWSVLKWNTPSIDFYQGKSVNATRMEEWVGMRVDGEALAKLAGGGGLDAVTAAAGAAAK